MLDNVLNNNPNNESYKIVDNTLLSGNKFVILGNLFVFNVQCDLFVIAI